ncbi:ABC transporter permease [Tessaracoccus massiliensis]|uniref:ABC transporter permease n=1 Tax=Tessaracoccus massiliensis TaxID=1522311 RepID=UPI00058B33D1|nr:FtsX-like permease family protein [Tessaracoccus massiliensis]
MLRATLKSVWARKLRLIMSALSIVLGVAFVAGSLMFTTLLSSGFESLVGGALADVNVSQETTGISGFENNPGVPPQLLTDENVAAVEAINGVARVEPMVSNTQVYALDADGSVLTFPGAPGLGMNWHDATSADGVAGARIIDGRAPTADDEVVIDPATVTRGGFSIGDTVEVSTPRDGIRSYTLVGTGTYGAGSTAGASYLFFTLPEIQLIAQEGQPGAYALWVQTAPEADPAAVSTAVAEVLPDGFVAETGDELSSEIEEQLNVGLGFVNIFLLVFAGIALLVAALLILNTFSILVAQRARELALFRAIGATRRQVRTAVLMEALFVGLVGATLGLAVGYGLAWGILGLLRGLGIDIGDVTPSITWQAVVASYAIGVIITLIAAYLPARRASATRPVEAMASAAQSNPEKLSGLPLLGIALIELGVAAIVIAVWLDVPQPLIWLGAGATALLIGMVLAAALVGAPVIWVFGKLFRGLFGEVGKLAQLNSVRQPRRTAATAATLMIGLALVTTVAILAASTTTSLRNQLTQDQRGDFVIVPVSYQPFDAKIAEAARGVDGVATVYEGYRGSAQIQGVDEPSVLFGMTREALERGTSLNVLVGAMNEDGGEAPVVLSADYANEHGFTLGQVIDLVGPLGTVPVLVTGLHDEGAAMPIGDIVVTPPTFAAVADASMVQQLVIFAEDGADPARVKAGLEEAAAQAPTVVVSDVHEFIEDRVAQFDQIFATLYALLALAIVISVLGIVNTLGLSVMERTREVGLLRAVGMTRAQVRRMVTLEAVIVAVLGAVLGVILGVVFGAALVTLLGGQGIDTLVIPWAQLLIFVVVAAVVGVLAAIAPARRASRLAVLESIADVG